MSEPFSAEEPTIWLDDEGNPVAGPSAGQYTGPQAKASGPGAPPTRPQAASARPPYLRRRVALLTATIYAPLILLGYALYQYGPAANCVAGPLCSFGEAPIVVQIMLCLVGFGLLYLVSARPLSAALDARQPAHSDFTRTLRQAARFETIRPLLAVFASLIALLLLLGVIARALPWPVGIIGLGAAALLLWLSVSGEP